MKPVEKWLIDVGAVASPQGWRHPRTNELLKAAKLNVVNTTTEPTESQDNPVLTPTQTEDTVTTQVEATITTDPVVETEKSKTKGKKANTPKEQAPE